MQWRLIGFDNGRLDLPRLITQLETFIENGRGQVCFATSAIGGPVSPLHACVIARPDPAEGPTPLAEVRRVRDEIDARVQALLAELEESSASRSGS